MHQRDQKGGSAPGNFLFRSQTFHHDASPFSESLSEAVKILKGEYCIKAIRAHNMDYGLIFCRTKLDCDNMEKYLTSSPDGGKRITCVCLHGDRKPVERKENLQRFKVSSLLA